MRLRVGMILILLTVTLSGVNSVQAYDTAWFMTPVISNIQSDAARPTKMDYGFGLGFGVRFHPHWAAEVFAAGDTLYAPDNVSHFYQRSVSLDGYFYLLGKSAFDVYLTGGIGGVRNTHNGVRSLNFMSTGGAGIQVRLSKWGLAMRSDVRYRYDNDNKSMANQAGFGDIFINLGLSIPLGSVVSVDNSRRVPGSSTLSMAADSDNDGIADVIDLCSKTPLGATVDARGCEIDSDNDGIVDSRDQCADTAPGLKVNALGCELDSDGDGLADSRDTCPNSTPGAEIDATGCEIATSEVAMTATTENMSQELKPINVNFDVGSARLDMETRRQLEELVKKVKSSEAAVIAVTGHTDITGRLDYNKTLAEKRAMAVSQFLRSRGIPPDKFRINARGPFEPIADNTTETGRAMNRRVELYVMDE